jgi:hypothetical protein
MLRFLTAPRLRRYVLLASLIVPTVLPLAGGSTVAAAAEGALWQADHNSGGLSAWSRDGCGGQFNNGAAYTEYTRGARDGTGGLRLRVPNMNTGESQGARVFRWCEAQEYDALYYSAWYYFPKRIRVRGWWWIMEWKSEGSFNAKFGLAVSNRRNGAMFVELARGTDSGGGAWEQTIADLPTDQWVHLEAYYKKAADQTGRVTVWQDGAQILDLGQVQTANSDDLGWAVVNYGQNTRPADVEIYVDDAAISTWRLGP